MPETIGRNSKPAYPDELSAVYSSVQNPEFFQEELLARVLWMM